MKHKLFNLKAWLVMLVMAFVSTGAWAEDYVLSFSKLTTGTNYNSYTAAHDVVCNGVTWSVFGNQSAGDFLRVGGKTTTATNRYLTSGSIGIGVSKIIISHNGITNGKNSEITINSLKLEVSSSEDFKELTDTKIIESPEVTSEGNLIFNPSSSLWGAKSYYRISLNYQISGSNNCGLNIVKVTLKDASTKQQADSPTLTASTSFLDSQEVTITNNESGSTVYYTTDGNDPTTSSTSFTGASKTFTVTSTTTVKAMAVATGKDNSSVASSTYTKMVKYDNVAAFVAANPTEEVALQLTNATIIGKGKYAMFVRDATGIIVIYSNSSSLPADAVYGKTITCLVTGTKGLYNSLSRINVSQFVDTPSYGTADIPFVGQEVAIADLTDELIGQQITVKSVKFQAESLTNLVVDVKDTNEKTLKVYDTFGVLSEEKFITTSNATVSGILIKYVNNTTETFELVPESADYIVYEDAKQKPTNTWSSAAFTATIGAANTFPTFETNSTGAKTYTSSNTSVATINETTGSISLVAPGTTKITCAVAENDDYFPGSASYELTVVKAAPVLEEGVYFYEDFSTVTNGNSTSTDGSNGGWNGKAENTFTVSGNTYQAGECVRLGTKSDAASISFGPLDLSQNGGIFHLSFDVKGWTVNENAVLTISVTGQEDVTRNYSATMTDEFENIDLVYSGGKENSYITISASKRTFIDNIKVYYSEVKNKPECNWSKEVAYGVLLDAEVYPTYNFVSPTFTSESEGEVTYSSSNPDVASIDAEGVITLKATGETTISATTAATTIYSEASASYQLYVVSLEGDGSFDKPFTPSDIVYLSNNLNDKYWVTGTIAEKTAAEQDSENNGMIADASKNVNTNVVLVDTKNNIPVGLASGSVRNFVNVKDNAGNVNKTVKIYGSLGAAYFNRPGVKDCSKVVIPEIQPSVTIDENGWGAHYNKYSYEIPEGLTAYTVDVDPITQTVTFSKLTSGTNVAAYTPLLFKGESGTSQYVIVNTNASAKQQKLRGQLEAGVLTSEKDSEGSEIACKYYKFDSASETFVYGAEEGGVFEVAANGVYLAVPTTISTGSVLSLIPTIVTVTRLINDALNTSDSKVTTNTISNQAEKVLKNQSVLEK